jgi:hypothetical protein
MNAAVNRLIAVGPAALAAAWNRPQLVLTLNAAAQRATKADVVELTYCRHRVGSLLSAVR